MATRTLDVIAATLVPSTNSGFLGLCTTPAHYLIMAQEESGEQTRVRVKVNDCKVCRSDNPNLKPTITVKTEIDGRSAVVAVCGDVFWQEGLPEIDKFANNPGKLKKSRKKILYLADYIIPGHNGMFKVNK